MEIRSTDALLLIDLQPDFMPGGALAVTGGDEIVPLVNRLARRFAHVILTQDWHPAGHISFASTHPGKQPYETTSVPYGTQVLWPEHCVQGSSGAAIHPGVDIPHVELILRKGFRSSIDSYSAFLENDRHTPTGLAGYLRDRGLTRIFVAGLAYDFCVRFSAIDGAALGFEMLVIEDGTRAVAHNASVAETHAALKAAGVCEITSSDVLG